MRTCNRCVIDEKIPGIAFGETCNYCELHEDMNKKYKISKANLRSRISQIKLDGIDSEYDAVLGISGGCDSSYLALKLSKMGLRLLLVHSDNGWNTETAKENIKIISEILDEPVKLICHNTDTFNSLCRSFLYASTPDADIPNDLSILDTIQNVAIYNNVKWVINGHSFRTEGTAPLGYTYMDGGYLEDVNERFEKADIGSFPHLNWYEQMKYINSGLKHIRPLYYMDYNKEKAKKYLEMYGWIWYGGLHNENLYTKFVINHLWTKKFNVDYRKIELSALVRSGQITREDALNRLKNESVNLSDDELSEVERRLNIDIASIMELPIRSYKDYNNYSGLFKHYDKFFKTMLKEDKISYTFYKKYCEGV